MVTVVAEYRLHRTEALVIKGLAGRAIDLLFHLLGHGIGMVTTGTLEEGNLTHFGALGVSQTLVAQRARQTIALGPGSTYVSSLLKSNKTLLSLSITLRQRINYIRISI